MITRYASSVAFASGITFALFFVMQMLVASGDAQLNDDTTILDLDMIRVPTETEIQRTERRVERPPEVDTPPPDLDLPQTSLSNRAGMDVSFGGAGVDASIQVDGNIFGGVTDGEYLPIVKVQPVYPRRAAERGIEGYVLLEFTVTELGTVEDVVVIEAEPSSIFNRAAINAALKFKYKPKVVNGEPMRVAGVRNLITFQLADE